MYTVSQHMPVYYRTFPGNMNDSRSLGTVMADMDHAGFPDIVFITDRGCQSLGNLGEMIRKERKTVMCTKTSLGLVADRIKALGPFGVRPDGMDADTELKLYMAQYQLDYCVKGNGGSVKAADRLRLNLYFDPVRWRWSSGDSRKSASKWLDMYWPTRLAAWHSSAGMVRNLSVFIGAP